MLLSQIKLVWLGKKNSGFFWNSFSVFSRNVNQIIELDALFYYNLFNLVNGVIKVIISGKDISVKIKNEIKQEINDIKTRYDRIPKLAVILVGHDQASQTYVRNKEKACQYVGMESMMIYHEASIDENTLLQDIQRLNEDDRVDGILVQLPLPEHIDEVKVLEAIRPDKDVDGFHPENVAKLFLGQNSLVPCTPKGMMVLLDEIHYDLTGKEVVVVGRSHIVGKPVAMLCLQKNATVTMAHSKTQNLKEVCQRADVLIVAIGKAKMINSEYVKPGAVVLDVGINRDENNKLCGDVDFEDVKDKVYAITPVPGGIGPMTITILLKNTLEAFYQHQL